MRVTEQDLLDAREILNEFNATCLTHDEFQLLFRKLGGNIRESDLSLLWQDAAVASNGGKILMKDLMDNLIGQEPQISDEERLLSHFRALPRAQKTKALDFLEGLHRWTDAQTSFQSSLEQTDRDLVCGILSNCSELGDADRQSINREEFKLLHGAVRQLVAQPGQEALEGVRSVLPADFCEAFADADLNLSRELGAVEVWEWLRRISQKLPGVTEREFRQKVSLRLAALQEVEKYRKASELQQSFRQYCEAFKTLKKHKNFEPVRSRNPASEGDLLQPGADGRETTYDDLVQQASGILRPIEALGAELYEHLGATLWSMGPLKARARSEEKIEVDYEGNARRLVDVARFSIVCHDCNMINIGIQYIDGRSDFEIVRVKSALDPDCKFALRSGGYRDCKLNVRHKASGHIFEVQLHALVFYSLKQEGGHALYKWARQFQIEGITSASDVLTTLNKNLLKEMIKTTQEELDDAIVQSGDDSLHVMHLRLTLVKLSGMAHDLNILHGHAQVLVDQASRRSIIGASANNFADIFAACGSCGTFSADESIQLTYKAMEIINSACSDADMDEDDVIFLGQCHAHVGSMCWRKENLSEAESNFRMAIQRFQDAVCPQHPTLLGYKRNLGAILVTLGSLDEALQLLHEVEAITTHAVQKGRVYMELGAAYEKKGEHAKACGFYVRTLEKRRADFGDAHVAVANAYLPLGRCKAKCGAVDEALGFLRLALRIYEPLLQDDKGARAGTVANSHAEAKSLISEIEKSAAH